MDPGHKEEEEEDAAEEEKMEGEPKTEYDPDRPDEDDGDPLGAVAGYQHYSITTNSTGAVALTTEIPRETWDKKVEFLLAVIGFAVDLGNVWRFPYICYQNGGGAFLIPYVIMLIFGGLPLFYMELALGQFHRCGCLSIWKRICPALKGENMNLITSAMSAMEWPVNQLMGIGYAICIIDIYIGMYYNTIIGWAVYFLFASMRAELPWTSCNNTWNTPNCLQIGNNSDINNTSPAKEFFERSVLEKHRAEGLDEMGPIKGSLALCVFSVFLLVYFSLWKGVKSTGKAVWITALAPYVVLFILLIRGITLPGAGNGIKYYLTPQWNKLLQTKVWTDAAAQIFFSLGPGFGTLLALSSYNKFNNNCFRDAILTSSINCLTSFIAGFVIFSGLGYMAHMQQKTIEEVGVEGPGLIFVVYPEALATMKGSVFWSIIFFLMLITLGLDSTFGGLEAMITAFCDEYPQKIKRHRELFVGVVVLFIYVCALPTTTFGGVALVDLLNDYGPSISILFVVFVEAAAVFWIYGVERFSNDLELMLGFRPGIFWRICWQYISPIFLLGICIATLMPESNDPPPPPKEYPAWSVHIGWIMTGSSLICIPIYAIYHVARTPGSFIQKVKTSFTPIDYPSGERQSITAATTYGTGTATHV